MFEVSGYEDFVDGDEPIGIEWKSLPKQLSGLPFQ
jgi:hypothetical protein